MSEPSTSTNAKIDLYTSLYILLATCSYGELKTKYKLPLVTSHHIQVHLVMLSIVLDIAVITYLLYVQ